MAVDHFRSAPEQIPVALRYAVTGSLHGQGYAVNPPMDELVMQEADVLVGLGERIRDRRRRKGWTLKELAVASAVSVPYLSDLERRQGVNPSVDTLTAVATALGCAVADLVGDQSPPGPPPPASFDRFIRSREVQREVEVLAARTGTSPEAVREQLLNFLAAAPRRSSGELSRDDWRRLLDVFTRITDPP